jgi:hypothetical protein
MRQSNTAGVPDLITIVITPQAFAGKVKVGQVNFQSYTVRVVICYKKSL